jgi:predicted RNA-binding Zn ribbon-like protein
MTRANNRPGTSHRDRVVATAIDLVNALAPGSARGHQYEPNTQGEHLATVANATFSDFHDQPAVFQPSERDEILTLVMDLHQVLVALGESRLADAVPLINTMMAKHSFAPHLSAEEPFSLHYQDHNLPAPAGWTTGCAASLGSFVSSGAWEYIGVCEASQCDRVFLDDTRNQSRRFCTTRCQNRVKVRAFRSRMR